MAILIKSDDIRISETLVQTGSMDQYLQISFLRKSLLCKRTSLAIHNKQNKIFSILVKLIMMINCAVIYRRTNLLELSLPIFLAFLFFKDCEHYSTSLFPSWKFFLPFFFVILLNVYLFYDSCEYVHFKINDLIHCKWFLITGLFWTIHWMALFHPLFGKIGLSTQVIDSSCKTRNISSYVLCLRKY